MKRLLKFIPVLIISFTIIALSHKSGLKSNFSQVTDIILRKQAHIFVFSALYVSFFIAIINSSLSKMSLDKFKNLSIISFIFILIFALSDEWHQSLVIERTAKPIDILYDSLGGILGYIIVWIIYIHNIIKSNMLES